MFWHRNDSRPLCPCPVRAGAGVGGSDRVEITWADNAIAHVRWLQVKVLANANTNLAAADVFYFGDAIGDTNGGNSTHVFVNGSDESNIRANSTSSADVTNIYDMNRDGVVDSTDESIAGNHPETFLENSKG